MDKTKIILYRCTQDLPASLAGAEWHYDGHTVAVVDQDKYLGVMMHAWKTGHRRRAYTLQCAASHRAQLGRKALHAFLALVYQSKLQQPSFLCRLFDILINPAVSYGAHVWGPYMFSPGGMFDHEAERVQIEFLRLISKAPKNTHIPTLYREYGRYPLVIRWIKYAARWWKHIREDSEPGTTLAYETLCSNVQLMIDGCNSCWAYKFFCALDCFGILESEYKVAYLRRNRVAPAEVVTGLVLDPDRVEDAGKAFYDREWVDCGDDPATAGSTEVVMSTHKHWVGCGRDGAPHLQVYLPGKIRSTLVRLRLGCHSLCINTGRMAQPPVPRGQRYCPVCALSSNTHPSVEDLQHFVFYCGAYSDIRSKYEALFNAAAPLGPGTAEALRAVFNYYPQKVVACCMYEMLQRRTDVLQGRVPDIPQCSGYAQHGHAHVMGSTDTRPENPVDNLMDDLCSSDPDTCSHSEVSDESELVVVDDGTS